MNITINIIISMNGTKLRCRDYSSLRGYQQFVWLFGLCSGCFFLFFFWWPTILRSIILYSVRYYSLPGISYKWSVCFPFYLLCCCCCIFFCVLVFDDFFFCSIKVPFKSWPAQIISFFRFFFFRFLSYLFIYFVFFSFLFSVHSTISVKKKK